MSEPMAALDEQQEAVRLLWRRRARTGAWFAVFFALPLIPWVEDRSFTFAWAVCFAVVGLSMNVLAGYAGQISLAHAVLLGTGAFTMGNLVTLQGVPWLVALPVSGFVAALIALGIGFPALRIRGLHLAIATLAFQFLMQRVVFRAEFVAQGAAGVEVPRPELFGVSLEPNQRFLWAVMILFVLILVLDRNLTRSRAGRAFFALRQDEQVAASFGIPVARYKLLAFGLSGFYAGLAGGMFGTLAGEVSAELFDFQLSIAFLVFVVLGGLGSRPGTAVGGSFPVVFEQIIGDVLRWTGQIIGGVLLVFTLVRHAGGLAEQGGQLKVAVRTMKDRGPKYLAAFFGCWVAAALAGVIAALVLPRIIAVVTPFDATLGSAVISGLVASITTLIILIDRVVEWAVGPLLDQLSGVHQLAAAEALEQASSRMSAGRALPAILQRAPRGRDGFRGPLLQIDGLEKRFGGVRALDGMSLEVRHGELVGVMGPNGSGKTTLFNCISGFLQPDVGAIRFRGRNLIGMSPHDRASLGIARTFQHVGLAKQETVFDNFLIAQHLSCTYSPVEGLLRTRTVVDEERILRMRAHAAVEMLGLDPVASERVSALPHGTAKMVELGCALVWGPEIVLLDEPAAGVDPSELETLGDTLKAVQRDFGVTVVLIEHHVPLVLDTCDYVYVLDFGQLLAEGLPGEVAQKPEVVRAYLGTAAEEVGDAALAGH